MKKKIILLILCLVLLLSGCAKGEISNGKVNNEPSLRKTDSLVLEYADQFSVDFYEDGYIHVSIGEGTDYVIVPENKEDNSLGLDNPVYIHKPCDSIYLAATAAMDLFLQLDSLDYISSCSTTAKDYAMPEVKSAIEDGEIVYIGKYSSPDYEMLLNLDSTLAIESTMIGHSPKVKEQIERIGIPVLIERSSYESDPIGRLEWIKLYGILTGKEQEAEKYFDEELGKLNALLENQKLTETNERKSVAFFSISSNGYVTVRKPGDYVCRMIEMAGGRYALDSLLIEEENALTTVNIGFEDFYREAKDADILIYNGTIDGGITSLDDLVEKNELIKDFKAYQNGDVWSTSLNMFQQSSKVVDTICEFSNAISGMTDTDSNYKYLIYLK